MDRVMDRLIEGWVGSHMRTHMQTHMCTYILLGGRAGQRGISRNQLTWFWDCRSQ